MGCQLYSSVCLDRFGYLVGVTQDISKFRQATQDPQPLTEGLLKMELIQSAANTSTQASRVLKVREDWVGEWTKLQKSIWKIIFWFSFYPQSSYFQDRPWAATPWGSCSSSVVLSANFPIFCLGHPISCQHSRDSATDIFHSYWDCFLQCDGNILHM